MQKETLKERVYRGIYEAVTNGEYRPNDILTENQMIEKFGVSKSPVNGSDSIWDSGYLWLLYC